MNVTQKAKQMRLHLETHTHLQCVAGSLYKLAERWNNFYKNNAQMNTNGAQNHQLMSSEHEKRVWFVFSLHEWIH